MMRGKKKTFSGFMTLHFVFTFSSAGLINENRLVTDDETILIGNYKI